MSFSPVISGSALAKNEIVGSENLSIGTGSDRVHGTGFKIDQNCTGNIFAARSLVIVNIDPLQLKIAVAMVSSGGVDSVLIGDNFPEL